ncbi:MAG: phosphoglycerate kinase [Candidatus Dormibacteria bacterium]
MEKQTIDDIEVAGRRVLLRVDFNVPLRDGSIIDDRKIREALPTLRNLRDRGARIVVITHIGRPQGVVDPQLSTEQLLGPLAALLGAEVGHVRGVVGEEVESAIGALEAGGILMLENVRFEPGEERNDPQLASRLARLGDVFCNDAFGAAHRAHASTEGVSHHLPAVAGYLMAHELEILTSVLHDPERPLVAIVGGSKISSKIGIIDHLLDTVDTLWVGGAMACTFYRALGEETGRSLVEEDWVERAGALYRGTGSRRGDLRLPVDVVIASVPDGSMPTRVVSWKEVPADQMVVDVGPETVALMAADAAGASTVVWNGPLGIYEVAEFARGTRGVAVAVAESRAFSVVGGGDLGAALEASGVEGRIGYISTGGGATLEFLEGRELPGVVALCDRVAVS